MRKTGLTCLLWGTILLSAPAPAYADAGIPMLPFAYPVILLFLLPVIAIEALYLRLRLRTKWGNTLAATAKANLVTMLLGFPLAWIVLTVLEMGFWYAMYLTGVENHLSFAPGNTLVKVVMIAMSAAWMGPVEERWAIPLAYVVLLIPSFVLSGYVEARLLGRSGWLHFDGQCERSVWQANLLSYIFLATCGGISLWCFVSRR